MNDLTGDLDDVAVHLNLVVKHHPTKLLDPIIYKILIKTKQTSPIGN